MTFIINIIVVVIIGIVIIMVILIRFLFLRLILFLSVAVKSSFSINSPAGKGIIAGCVIFFVLAVILIAIFVRRYQRERRYRSAVASAKPYDGSMFAVVTPRTDDYVEVYSD